MEFHDRTKSLLWLLLLILFGIVVGGSVYLMTVNDLQKDREDLQNQINTLQRQLNGTNGTNGTTIEAPIDETADWQTYTNEEYGFSIKYPNYTHEIDDTAPDNSQERWIAAEEEAEVLFGPRSSSFGGYVFGITISTAETLEALAAQQGRQFDDRKQVTANVSFNGITGKLVTTTTASHTSWVSKVVYIEQDNKIFSISNGSVDRTGFEVFYNSFQFIN